MIGIVALLWLAVRLQLIYFYNRLICSDYLNSFHACTAAMPNKRWKYFIFYQPEAENLLRLLAAISNKTRTANVNGPTGNSFIHHTVLVTFNLAIY